MSEDTYRLRVTNRSNNPTSFAIYQDAPEVENAQSVFTLAWQCRYAAPGVTVAFSWTAEANAVWCQPGQRPAAGVVCETVEVSKLRTATSSVSSQVVNVNPEEANEVILSYDKSHNAYYFGPVNTAPNKGKIYTRCDGGVPNASVATPSAAAVVGIGMGGAGAFVVGAEPNKTFTWTLPGAPVYRLIAGDRKRGEILDINDVGRQALELTYKDVLEQAAELTDENILQRV